MFIQELVSWINFDGILDCFSMIGRQDGINGKDNAILLGNPRLNQEAQSVREFQRPYSRIRLV